MQFSCSLPVEVNIDVLSSIAYQLHLLSLSMIVLNSRDWSEIIWLPEISHLKINLAIGFIRKNQPECIG